MAVLFVIIRMTWVLGQFFYKCDTVDSLAATASINMVLRSFLSFKGFS